MHILIACLVAKISSFSLSLFFILALCVNRRGFKKFTIINEHPIALILLCFCPSVHDLISGLSGQVDEELLKDAFASFGQVIDGMCVVSPLDDDVLLLVMAHW